MLVSIPCLLRRARVDLLSKHEPAEWSMSTNTSLEPVRQVAKVQATDCEAVV